MDNVLIRKGIELALPQTIYMPVREWLLLKDTYLLASNLIAPRSEGKHFPVVHYKDDAPYGHCLVPVEQEGIVLYYSITPLYLGDYCLYKAELF